jgi:hypothetical protein
MFSRLFRRQGYVQEKLFLVIPAGLIVCAVLSLIPILLTWEVSILSAIAYVLIPILTIVVFCMPYITGHNLIGSGRFMSGLVLFIAGIFFGGAHGESYTAFTNTAAIIFLIAGLFTFNRENLRDATKQGEAASRVRFPPGMRRNNIIMLVILIILGIVIANFESLRVFAADAVIYIIYLIVQFMLWLGSLMGIGGGGGGEGTAGEQPPLGGEAHQPNPLIEMIVHIIVIAIVVAAVLLIIFALVKAIRKLLTDMPDWLKRLLNRLSSEGDQSYIDETEDLLEKGGLRKEIAKNLSNLWDNLTYRAPKFEDMPDNREKVRFVFKHLLKRVYLRKRSVISSTPIELTDDANKATHVGTEDFIEAYNQARLRYILCLS